MRILYAVVALALASFQSDAGAEQFSCDMMALTKDELALYQELTQALFAAVEEKKELRDGYEFRLPPEALVTTSQWITYERKCCPFFAFELEVSKDAGPLWLRITGSRGVKEFIRTEFEL